MYALLALDDRWCSRVGMWLSDCVCYSSSSKLASGGLSWCLTMQTVLAVASRVQELDLMSMLRVHLAHWTQKLGNLMCAHQYQFLGTSCPMSPILITAQLNLRYGWGWGKTISATRTYALLFCVATLAVSFLCCNIFLRFYIWRRCEQTIYTSSGAGGVLMSLWRSFKKDKLVAAAACNAS